LPKLYVHEYIDRIFLGKTYGKLHRQIDKPVFYMGYRHRELFHDVISTCFIASKVYPNDEKAITSAQLHIHYDELCSSDPYYRKHLEKMAKLDKQRRTQNQRKKKNSGEKTKKSKGDDQEPLLRLIEIVVNLKQS
jgi:hypothetical protein